MFAALRKSFSLTAEQRALFKAKRIEGRFGPDDLIAKLKPLAEFDRIGDKGRSAGCGIIATLVLVAVVGGFLVLASDVSPVWFLGIVGTCLFFIVVVAVLNARLSRLDDQENYLRSVALPFLSALRQDLADGAELDVRIDFSRIKQKSKRDRVEKPPLPKGFSKLVNTYYKNPWFEGSAPLAIGGRVHWQVTDTLLESSRTKRGSSGKWKMKTKTKKTSRLDVKLALPARRYRAVSAGDPDVAIGDRRIEVALARKMASGESTPVLDGLIDLVALAFNKVKPITANTEATP